jgi:4-diphosphocytidyl-2-C-methyl-D-erythritol kinase
MKLVAPAKVTWSLAIEGRRRDGYHDIDAEMLTVSLADELTISEGDGLEIIGADDLHPGENNLVSRALAVVGRSAHVVLRKNIPRGGGLGGGSADAAAVLRWAGGVSDDVAVQLGGDVPFCQRGGRARVRGIGDVIEPLSFVEQELTIFTVDFGISTQDAYAAFDELVALGHRPSGRNHLEIAARKVHDRMGPTIDFLRSEYGDVTLAGSGSSMFVEGWRGNTGEVVQGPAGPIYIHHVVSTPAV